MLFGRLQPLETTTADPVDRLAIIAEATAAFCAASDKSSNTQLLDLLDLVGTLPTALLGATMKAASVLSFSGPTIANTTVTNVRGPNEPMYFHGARLLRVTWFGAADRRPAPIPRRGELQRNVLDRRYRRSQCAAGPVTYAECMETAFQELLAAAG
jgi:diacylglycerol O-acyltransferase / wax synthase